MKYVAIVVSVFATASPGAAQQNPAPLMAAEKAAMARFDGMDGEWRGEAVTQTPAGEHRVTQTERVGSLLGGTIKLIEGRAYRPDGSTGFNALGMLKFDPATGKYQLGTHAEGRYGEFELTPTASGFSWVIPAGPMTIKYAAEFRDGTWIETGVREMPGRPPVQFFKMELKRIGDSAWPAAGAVKPR